MKDNKKQYIQNVVQVKKFPVSNVFRSSFNMFTFPCICFFNPALMNTYMISIGKFNMLCFT